MTAIDGRPATKLLALWRINALLVALGAGAVGGFTALIVQREGAGLALAAALPAILVTAAAVFVVAAVVGMWFAQRSFEVCRWQHWPGERVVVWRGAWWQREIWIPLARLQHLDVVRGPLERRLGLASLELYTAGAHDHKTRLPGMLHDEATRLRDTLLGEMQRLSSPAKSPARGDETA